MGRMMARRRYLLAYDIGSPSRSRRVLKLVRAQSVGWQKSVYECVLSSLERLRLLEQVAAMRLRLAKRLMLGLIRCWVFIMSRVMGGSRWRVI